MARSKEIINELETVTAINVIADMEGGKILAKALRRDIMTCIDRLCADYKTVPFQELVGHCAALKSNIDLLRVLKRSDKNKKFLEEELELSLKEETES